MARKRKRGRGIQRLEQRLQDQDKNPPRSQHRGEKSSFLQQGVSFTVCLVLFIVMKYLESSNVSVYVL